MIDSIAISEPKKCCERGWKWSSAYLYWYRPNEVKARGICFCDTCGARLHADGTFEPCPKPLPFSLSEEDCQKHAVELARDMGLHAFAGGGSCAACLCAEAGHVHFPTWAETRAALLGVRSEKTRLAQIIHGAIPECEGMGEAAEKRAKADAERLAKELGLTVVLNEDSELNWIAEVPVAGLPERFLSVARWEELTLLLRGMRTERWRAEREGMGEKAEAKPEDDNSLSWQETAEDLAKELYLTLNPDRVGWRVEGIGSFENARLVVNALMGYRAGWRGGYAVGEKAAPEPLINAIPSEGTNNEREAFDLAAKLGYTIQHNSKRFYLDGTGLRADTMAQMAAMLRALAWAECRKFMLGVLYGQPPKAEIPEGEVLATENVSGWVHPDRLALGHARLIDELSKGMGPLTANGTGEGLVAITATTTVRRREVPAKLRRWRVTWLKGMGGGMIGRMVEVKAGSEVDAREIAAMAFRRENGDGPDCYTVKVEALDN